MNAITSRVTNLVWELPKTCFNEGIGLVKTIAGVAATPLSMMTLGKVEKINNWAHLTEHSFGILPGLFIGSLRVINPKAYIRDPDPIIIRKNSKTEEIPHGNGIITTKIASPFFKLASDASKNSESTFQKHIISRGAYALGGIVAMITRVADLILGLCALPFAVITCGSRPHLNHFVARHLQFIVAIHDVCCALRGIINPQQLNKA